MNGTIWLMRHGALPPNPEGRFVGQQNMPLSELGRRQALSWRQHWVDIPFVAIISSDLRRCVETALLVKGENDIPLIREPAFREISLGAWEGLTPDEVEERFPGAYAARGKDMAHFRPNGGESFTDLALRVLPAFGKLAVRYGGHPLLIVGHAGVNRTIIAHRMAIPLKNILDIPQHSACCVQLFAQDSAGHHKDGAQGAAGAGG